MPQKHKLSDPVRLRPTATAQGADTYVRPGVKHIGRPENTNNWQRLAKVFEKQTPAVTAWAAGEVIEEQEEKKKEGSLWMEQNRQEFIQSKKTVADFFNQHPELKGYSPLFIKGATESYLSSLGEDYEMGFRNIMDANGGDFAKERGIDIMDYNDPTALQRLKDSYRQDFIQRNLQGYDATDIQDNFVKSIGRAEAQIDEMYMQKRTKLVVARRDDTYSDETSKIILNNFNNPERLTERLQEAYTKYFSDTQDARQADNLMLAQLYNEALAHDDMTIFDAGLKVIKNPAVNGTLGGTSGAKASRAKLREALDKQRITEEKNAQWRRDRNFKNGDRDFKKEFGAALREDPTMDFNEFIKKKEATGGLRFVTQPAITAMKTLARANRTAVDADKLDPTALVRFRSVVGKLTQEEAEGRLLEIYDAGQITPEQYFSNQSKIEERANYRSEEIEDILRQSDDLIQTVLGVSDTHDETGSRSVTATFVGRALRDVRLEVEEYIHEVTEDPNKGFNFTDLKERIRKETARITESPEYWSPAKKRAVGLVGSGPNDRATQEIIGTYKRKVSPEQFIDSPADVDATTDVVFLSARQLNTAIGKWEKGNGQLIRILAEHAGMDERDFITAQTALMNPNVPYKFPDEKEAEQAAADALAAEQAAAEAKAHMHETNPLAVLQDWEEYSDDQVRHALESQVDTAEAEDGLGWGSVEELREHYGIDKPLYPEEVLKNWEQFVDTPEVIVEAAESMPIATLTKLIEGDVGPILRRFGVDLDAIGLEDKDPDWMLTK